MRFLPISFAVLAICLAACESTTSTDIRFGAADPGVVKRSRAVRAWQLTDGDVVYGEVVRFQEPDDPRRAFYSVRDPHHFDRGLIDGEGRAWCYRAHEAQPEWLGTGTVQEGARRILAAPPEAQLAEVPLGDGPAGPEGPGDAAAAPGPGAGNDFTDQPAPRATQSAEDQRLELRGMPQSAPPNAR